MASAVGDLVATLSMNSAPFQSALTSAQQHIVKFSAETSSGFAQADKAAADTEKKVSALGKAMKVAFAPLAPLLVPFQLLASPMQTLAGAVNSVLSPLNRMFDTLKETAGQIVDLINPVNWLAKAFNALAYPIQWAARGLEGILDAKPAIDAFTAFENASVRLQGALAGVGKNAGVTYRELEKLAGGKASKMEAMMPLVMSGLKDNELLDTIKVVQDLAKATGGDLTAASRAAARAMQDPIKGMRALREVGVFFTASEEAQIKAMMASGQTSQAHAMILEKLRAAAGDTAAMMSGTLSGAMRKYQGTLEEISVIVGQALKPVMLEVIGLFQDLANWVLSHKSDIISFGQSAANSFHNVIAPLREFIDTLKSGDLKSAWIEIELALSRVLDRIVDIKNYAANMFSNMGPGLGKVWDIFKTSMEGFFAYFTAKLSAAIATGVAAAMPDVWGMGSVKQRMMDHAQQLSDAADMAGSLAASGLKGMGEPLKDAFKAAIATPIPHAESDRTKGLEKALDQSKAAFAAAAKADAAGKYHNDPNKDLDTAARAAAEHAKKEEPVSPTVKTANAEEKGSVAAWKTITDAMYGRNDKEDQKISLLTQIAKNTGKGVGNVASDALDDADYVDSLIGS